MSYQLITLTGNESLSWAYPFTGGIVVADYNDVTANNTDYTLTLPPANNIGLGATVFLNNVGANAVTIAEYGSLETIITLFNGQIYIMYLTDNSTAAGSWTPIPFGGGVSNITDITIESSDGSVNVNGGDISSPGGTVDLTLSQSLTNLNDLTSITTPGYLVISDNLPLQYVTRSLVAGTNINIANPDGIANSTTISLQSDLTNLTSILVSDSANNNSVITSTSIVITDSAGNTANISSSGLTTSSLTPNPMNAAAWVRFSDTGSGCASAIVIQSSYNVAIVTGASGFYTITFTNSFTSNNYAVFATLQQGTGTGVVLSPFQVFVTSPLTQSVNISCVDTLGNLLAPTYGVSVSIFSN